ncbi:hypothetical protein C8R45DRAFT_1178182 [Mycena sanguinolenta]|nr:hypothetical protein C8R45DRAFT_1178182 [Mycena sanguinolenta]
MTITDRLPPEILAEIVAALPKKDQLSLCLVSKIWTSQASSATPMSPSVIQRLFRSWNAIPHRVFGILLYNTKRSSAIKALVPGEGFCLTNVRLYFNHTTVSTLHSFRHSRVRLPSLQRFSGESEFVPALVTQQLRMARLVWDDNQNIEKTVVALLSISNPDHPFHSINNTVTASHPECIPLVEALATHFPNLKTPCGGLREIPFPGSPEQETLDHLTTRLPRFKMLKYLALEDGRSRYANNGTSRDKLYALVTTEWASVCPALEACCISQFAFKKSHAGVWQDCKRTEFKESTGALWYC